MHRDCDALTFGGAAFEGVNLSKMLFSESLDERFDRQYRKVLKREAASKNADPVDPFEAAHQRELMRQRTGIGARKKSKTRSSWRRGGSRG